MQLAEEILGVSAAKTDLSRRLRKLQSGELERVVIVRQNSPVAVILTIAEYERMRDHEAQTELLDDLRLLLTSLESDRGNDTRIPLDEIKARLGIRT